MQIQVNILFLGMRIREQLHEKDEELHSAASEYPAVFSDQRVFQMRVGTVQPWRTEKSAVVSVPVFDGSQLRGLRDCLAEGDQKIFFVYGLCQPERLPDLVSGVGGGDLSGKSECEKYHRPSCGADGSDGGAKV